MKVRTNQRAAFSKEELVIKWTNQREAFVREKKLAMKWTNQREAFAREKLVIERTNQGLAFLRRRI